MDADLLASYARHQRARGLSPDTLRCYGSVYRAFTRHLADRGLTLLTVERDVIVAWLESGERVNRTRRMYATRLHLLFQFLQDEGLRDDLPTKGLPRPKIPRAVPHPIPYDELCYALEVADERVGLMLALAGWAGLRRMEIAQIDRADILDRRRPPLLLVHGKGSKERLVPIGPVVAQALADYGLPAFGPLFTNRSGAPLSRHSVGLLISGHLRDCGVDPDIASAHPCRHSFATGLYEISGDIRVVQEMLGHQSPASTAIYAAWSPERAATAIAALPSRIPPEAA